MAYDARFKQMKYWSVVYSAENLPRDKPEGLVSIEIDEQRGIGKAFIRSEDPPTLGATEVDVTRVTRSLPQTSRLQQAEETVAANPNDASAWSAYLNQVFSQPFGPFVSNDIKTPFGTIERGTGSMPQFIIEEISAGAGKGDLGGGGSIGGGGNIGGGGSIIGGGGLIGGGDIGDGDFTNVDSTGSGETTQTTEDQLLGGGK